MRTAPIPNVHPSCRLQVIDDSTDPPRWRTVAECFDAPNPIRREMRRHGLSQCWIVDCLGGRRLITQEQV